MWFVQSVTVGLAEKRRRGSIYLSGVGDETETNGPAAPAGASWPTSVGEGRSTRTVWPTWPSGRWTRQAPGGWLCTAGGRRSRHLHGGVLLFCSICGYLY
jgi:hypothetical protein